MKRFLPLLLAVLALAGCAESKSDKVINEVQNPTSPLRTKLRKASEHLPPGSSIEAQTRQAAIEAEQAEAAAMTPKRAKEIIERESRP